MAKKRIFKSFVGGIAFIVGLLLAISSSNPVKAKASGVDSGTWTWSNATLSNQTGTVLPDAVVGESYSVTFNVAEYDEMFLLNYSFTFSSTGKYQSPVFEEGFDTFGSIELNGTPKYSGTYTLIAEADNGTYQKTYTLKVTGGHIVKYDSNGGSAVESEPGASVYPNSFPVPTKENYVFEGWYKDNYLPASAGAQLLSDVTLQANWIDWNKCSAGLSNITLVNGIDETKAESLINNMYPSNPTSDTVVIYSSYEDEGDTFYNGIYYSPIDDSWIDEGVTDLPLDQIKSFVNEGIVEVYVLGTVSYGANISFNTNGGSSVANVKSDKIVFPDENPTKAGFVFGGWYTNEVLTIEAIEGAEISEDITLYAKWIPGGYCGDPEVNEGKNLIWRYDESTKTLTISGNGNMVNNFDEDDYGWYTYRNDILNIVVEDGVTSIGDVAFSLYKNATSISLGKDVKTIGEFAFESCKNITSIVFPDSLETIGECAFVECEKLESITFGNGLKTIGKYAFYQLDKLTSLNFPNSLETIKYEAFYECKNIESITFGSGLKTIEDEAFCGLSKLTSLDFPNSLETIGFNAFSDCRSLTSIKLGSGIKVINPRAFFNTSLTSITIEREDTEIGSNSFGWMPDIDPNCSVKTENFVIKGHVTTTNPFTYFENTKDSEETWKYYDFANVSFDANGGTGSMSSVVALSDATTNDTRPTLTYDISNLASEFTAPEGKLFAGWAKSSDGNVITDEKITLTADTTLYAKWITGGYCGDPEVNEGKNVIWTYDESTKTVTISGNGDMANFDEQEDTGWFACYGDILKVVIEDGVTSVGDNAFYYFEIADFSLGNTIKTIGNYAFAYNSSLKSIVLPNSVETIGNYAFLRCENLETITFGNGLKTICNSAFAKDSSLKSIVLPNSLETIKQYAFFECENLETITFGNGLKTICNSAFEFDSSLKSIVLPNSLETIGSNAFSSTGNITSLTLGSGLKTIDKYAFFVAFSKSKEPVEIIIPDSVETIGNYAFYMNEPITSIVLGSGLKTIGELAFFGANIESIIIKNNITIEEKVFGYVLDHINIKEVQSDDFIIKSHVATSSGFNYFKGNTNGTWKYYDFATVSFNNNGGSGTMDPIIVDSDAITSTTHSNFILDTSTISCGFTAPSGKVFAGWATSANGDINSSTVVTDDIELYAIWEVPHVHTYGEITYTWNSDNTKCTATRVCVDDPTHIETETVNTVKTVTQTKTCTLPELSKFTASFENEVFSTKTKENVQTDVALGHDLLDVNKQDATCTTEGHQAGHNCSRCDYKDGQEVIAAKGHTYSTEWSYNDLTHWHAATCEHTTEMSDAASHTWKAGVVSTNPTEDAKGVRTYTCTVCGKTKTEDIDKLTHEKGEHHNANAATCTAAGNVEYWDCKNCSNKLDSNGNVLNTITVAAIGHDYVSAVTTNPTCTEKGVRTYTCTHDSLHTYTENIDALDHDLVDVNKQDATCTTEGHQAGHNCSRCDYKDGQEVIAAKGHTYSTEWSYNDLTHWHAATCEHTSEMSDVASHAWNAGVVTTEPTETSKGVRTYACTVCGKTKTENIDKLTHEKGEHHNANAATCTAAGNVEYWDCKNCSNKLDSNGNVLNTITVAAIGHDYVSAVTTNPTCTEKGVRTYTCTHDSLHTYTENIDALDHDLVDVTKRDATCTAEGHQAGHNCSRCDYKDGQEVIAVKGHSWGAYVSNNDASLDSDGTKTRICANDASHIETVTDPGTKKVPSKDNVPVGGTKPNVSIETENGFDPNIVVEVKVEVIAGQVEEGSSLAIDYSTQLSENETLSGVYDVKLLLDGVEIPVSQLGTNATITVKMLVPSELVGKTFRIIHVHDASDITEIRLGDEAGIGTYIIDENGYLVTKIDRLSEFAFIEINDNGLSAGAIVGIILASLLGLILIAYVLGYFFCYRKGHLDDSPLKVIYKWLPRGDKKKDNSQENKEESKE